MQSHCKWSTQRKKAAPRWMEFGFSGVVTGRHRSEILTDIDSKNRRSVTWTSLLATTEKTTTHAHHVVPFYDQPTPTIQRTGTWFALASRCARISRVRAWTARGNLASTAHQLFCSTSCAFIYKLLNK